MIRQLGIHREIETVVGIGPTMLAGIGLVALAMVVMLRVTPEADLWRAKILRSRCRFCCSGSW